MAMLRLLAGLVMMLMSLQHPLTAHENVHEVILAYAEVQIDDEIVTSSLRIEQDYRFMGVVLFLSGQVEDRTKGVFLVLKDAGPFGLEVFPQVVECDGTIKDERGFTIYPRMNEKFVREITLSTHLSCAGTAASLTNPAVVTLVIRRADDLMDNTQ